MRGTLSISFLTLFLLLSSFAQTQTLNDSQPLNLAGWEIYPNPFYNTFTVASDSKNLEVEVFDIQGRRLPSTIFRFHEESKVLYQTGLELSKGLYLVRVSNGSTHRCYKMMKL